MEVKDIQGKTLIDAPITESAVITEELMKQYSITLGWDAISADVLPVGSYIEHNGVRYSLLAPYNPQQRDETTYEYKPVFEHPVMRWQHLPFFHYTYSGDSIVSKETDWSLTDNAANFMAAVCAAIQEQTGEDWSYEIADNLPASGDLSFSNTDIFSALTSIAGKFETEWWFDYESKTIYLSKASHGSEVSLEVGRNIGIPSTTQSRDGYATRFYVFGSTRNIEQNYAGSNVNSIVNKRLTLNPAKYPNGYIDIKAGLTNEEILVKTLTFDDIYPRSMLTISNVKVRLMWRLDSDNQKVQIGTDADGKPVYDQYAIWYFKIPGLSFNKDMVISGKALSVHFNDGPLQGREFELTYHDAAKDVETSDGTSIRVDAGDFEINFIEEGTYIIPAMTGLVPVDGNSVSLFNIVMPEEYMASAYEELEKAALKEIAKQGEDMSNYSFSSNAVEFFMSNPALKVGRKVTYKNGDYTYSTRIIKLETQLDRPYEQKITIGNEQIKGNTQTLKEEVVSANQNIDLISAINESTQQLMQSYQRTQKALLDSMSKWGNMWRLDAENNAVYTPLNMIVEGTLAMGRLGEGGGEAPVAGLQKVSITIPNYDNPFVSDAFGNVTLPAYPTALKNPYALKINGVTYDGSKAISINIEGGGGIADSVAWENVVGRPTALSEFENDLVFITSAALNGYATEQWVKQQGYLTQHQDLSAYAKSVDVANTYATKVALQTLQNDHNALSTKVTNLDNLLNSDVSGVINTWGEVVDFLDEYSGSEDLATILAGMNNDIANRVIYTDFDKLEDAVDGIAGYFTNGSAINALKLGGQLPSYYATADALNIVKNDVTAVSNRVKTFEDVIGIDANGDVYIKGIRNFYTAGGTIGMAGLGSGGSGGGGAAGIVTVRVNGYDYNSVNGIVTLPDYPSLSGYATQSWVGDNYLPLSGGRLNGKGIILVTNSTNGGASAINLQSADVNKGQLCWDANSGIFIYNYESNKYLGIKNDGTPFYSNNTLLHSGNYSSYVLPLTGGTISSEELGALSIKRNATYAVSLIKFENADGIIGYIGVSQSNVPLFSKDLQTYHTLIHSGNYGSYAVKYDGGASIDNARHSIGYDNRSHGSVDIPTNGGYIAFGHDSYGGQLLGRVDSSALFYRGIANNVFSTWKTIAFTDSNVASATKLQTARTIWGQSFDGTEDIPISRSAAMSYTLFSKYDGSGYAGYVGRGASSNNSIQLETYGAEPIDFSTNSTGRMRITNDGSILVNTYDAAGARFKVNGVVRFINAYFGNATEQYTPADLGDLGNGTIGLAGAEGYGLYAWTDYSSGNTYLQCGRRDGEKASYDLLLQTMGGKVGVGTANPSAILDVNGSAKFNSTITLSNSGYFIGGSNGFRFNDSSDTYNNFIVHNNGDTTTRGTSVIKGHIQINNTTDEQAITFFKNSVNRNQIDAASENFYIFSYRSAGYWKNDLTIHRETGNVGIGGNADNTFKLKVYGTGDFTTVRGKLESRYIYPGSVMTPNDEAQDIFTTGSESLAFTSFMSDHPLWNNWSDVWNFSGYGRWGGTQFATEYNAISPRVAIRKYNQTRSNWGDWTEFITSANIGSQSVAYATNATRMYASDSPYRYGDSFPFYAQLRYNVAGDGRWYLSVYPESPKTIVVDYAYKADELTNTRYLWGKAYRGAADVYGDIKLGTDGGNYKIGSAYATHDQNMYNHIVFGSGGTGLEYRSGNWTSGNHEAHKFIVGTSEHKALVIHNDGNICVGGASHSNAKVRIQKKYSHYWGWALGSLVNGSDFALEYANSSYVYGLYASVNASTGQVGLQVGRSDGDTSAYDLCINPLGGNLLVGTTSSGGAKLRVQTKRSDTFTWALGSLASKSDMALEYYHDSSNIYGLYTAINYSSGDVAMQVGRSDGGTSAYNLALNPLGGDVMIGTTSNSDGYKLNIASSGNRAYDFHIYNSTTKASFFVGIEAMWYGSSKTTGQMFAIMRGCSYDGGGGTVVFEVNATGDVWSEGTIAMAKLASSSDAKLKENIKWLSADRAIEVVRALRPTEWNWKKDRTHSFGFIAQDVHPIIPEMVSSVNDTLRLEYNQLHAFEIGAIQHIDSEVEQLKKDLKTTNNRIEVLENELNEYRRTAQWQ